MPLDVFENHKIPLSSSQEHHGTPANHLPLLPSDPDGVGRQPITQVLTFNAKGEKRRERDSNPRRREPHTLSKRAPSATRSSLLKKKLLRAFQGQASLCFNSSPALKKVGMSYSSFIKSLEIVPILVATGSLPFNSLLK